MPASYFITCTTMWLLLLSTHATGQWRGIRFEEIGQKDGFMAHGVNDMAQDSLGHLYFATEMGLLRYDGTVFEYFQHDAQDSSGIAEGKVSCIIVDARGFLWLGMHDKLSQFDPRTGDFINHRISSHTEARSVVISSILDDTDQIWIGESYHTLYRFDKSTGSVVETYVPDDISPFQISDLSALGIHKIIHDRTDPEILWLGVNELGLVKFNIMDKRFTNTGCLLAMPWQDHDGVLWSGSFLHGLMCYDPVSKTCTAQPITVSIPGVELNSTPPTYDVIRVQDQLWLGAPHGVLAFDKHGNQSALYYDRENENILKFFQDQDRNIWIGPLGGSVRVFNPSAQHIRFFSLNDFEPTRRYYPSWQVYDPVKDRILAVHGWRNKIYAIDMARTQTDRNKAIETYVPVRGITVDQEHAIWVAGQDRLYVLDSGTDQLLAHKSSALQQVDYPSLGTWQLGSDAKGNLTILGYYGFIYYDVENEKAFRIPIDSMWDKNQKPEIFWSHSIDHTGGIWLTTESVIGHYNPVEGTFTKYPNLLPDRNPRWRSTVMDRQGQVWCIGNTLEQFELQNDGLAHVRSLSSPRPPKNLSGVHLHVDGFGRIWSFGQNGLFGVNPESLEVRAFDLNDGLDNMYLDPLQSVNLPDGAILTHGGTGVMIFQPDSLWSTGEPPQANIVIKQVRISGLPYQSTSDVNYLTAIDLTPDDHFVDIHYRAIAMPRPRRVTYSYQVKGLSDTWIFHGTNETVTLTDLGPGDYTFLVKTGSPDSDAPVKSLNIHVATPYYLQVWFLSLLCFVVLASAYLIYRTRVQRIRREEELKTEFNKKIAEVELQALRAQMNPHFMFNSLNSIKSYILKSGPLEAAEYLTNFSSLIRSILDNSREKQISLQKELDALLLYIDLEKMRFPDKFNFMYKSSGEIPLEAIMTPPLILQPFVENAIWHGLLHKEEQGILMLSVHADKRGVECVIEDDGIGRKQAAELKKKSPRRYKSMGMGITRDRIELHNKLNELGIVVEIIDKEDDRRNALGTKVIIHFPISPAYA